MSAVASNSNSTDKTVPLIEVNKQQLWAFSSSQEGLAAMSSKEAATEI